MQRQTLAAAALAACAAWPLPAHGQSCTPQLVLGEVFRGTDGEVSVAYPWDPDGPGPQPTKVAVAGNFDWPGDVGASRKALYDPQSRHWSKLTTTAGGPGPTYAFASGLDGKLYAAGGSGVFRMSSFSPGTTYWEPLGGSMTGTVYALAVMPNGDLVAGGQFSTGQTGSVRLARWNGTSWSSLGLVSGADSTVYSVAVLNNGDLLVGGWFTGIGSATAQNLARWNGATWSAVGLGGSVTGPAGHVTSMQVLPNGDLAYGSDGGGIMCGLPGGASLACYHPVSDTFSTFGTGVAGRTESLACTSDGVLVASGKFTGTSGSDETWIARWDGAAWTSMGSGPGTINALASFPDGAVFVGGLFVPSAQRAAVNAAICRPSPTVGTWSPTNPGFDVSPTVAAELPSGAIIAGGAFFGAGDADVKYVARRDPGSGVWSPLGLGVDGPVSALLPLDGDDFIVAGLFANAGGAPAKRIARWSQTSQSWSALGPGLPSSPLALLRLANGDILAGGSFPQADGGAALALVRWDGTQWHAVGVGGSGAVRALLALDDTRVLVGGDFLSVGGVPANRLAIWNRVTGAWSPSGPGVNGSVYALARLSSGLVIAGGTFMSADGAPANRLAQWTGTTWKALDNAGVGPNNNVSSIVPLPFGSCLIGGRFTMVGSMGVARLVRYDANAGFTGPAVYALKEPTLATAGDSVLVCAPTTLSIYDPSYAISKWRLTPSALITHQPISGRACIGQPLTLSMRAETSPALTIQWRRNGVTLPDAARPHIQISVTSTYQNSTLVSTAVISGLTPADAGTFNVWFSTGCGIYTSASATVAVGTCPPLPCNKADIAEVGSTADAPGLPDGQLTSDDLMLFLAAWNDGTGCPRAGAPGEGPRCNPADITNVGNTGLGSDGQLTVDDVITFVNAFSAGC